MSRTLKPTLIKFSCPACGTRLAVPMSMAGVEDHCPKCSALVAAPTQADQPAQPATPEPPPDTWTTQPDAPTTVESPASSSASEPTTEESAAGLRPSLLDEFLSGQPNAETITEAVARPQKKSRAKQPPQEDTPEMAVPPKPFQDEPVQDEPSLAESPLTSDPGPIDEPLAFDQPIHDSWNEPPSGHLPDIGMGEALVSYSPAPILKLTRLTTAPLGVGLVHVADMPRTDRRSRRSRRLVAGVFLFLLIDASAAAWFFRHRLEDWWTRGGNKNAAPVAAHTLGDKPDPIPEKNDPPATTQPSVIPPVAVEPKVPETAVKISSEIPNEPVTPPAPEVAPPPPVPPPPAVATVEPMPAKLPETSTLPPLVTAKIDVEPPPPPPPVPSVTGPEVAATPAPSIGTVDVVPGRSALDALKAFLAAPSISERLRWCQKPDAVRPLMEKHYTSHPDGPVKVGRIDLIASYPSKDGVPPYSMFELTGGSLKRSVLALVEEKPAGEHRVDWETFVEFKDGLLWEFMSKPDSRPKKFRVIMRRTHYFDKDVPDVGSKDGFEISQPGSDGVAHVFVVRSNPISRQLAQRLGWDAKVPITLELVWRTEGTRHWVEIQSVPSFGWRG